MQVLFLYYIQLFLFGLRIDEVSTQRQGTDMKASGTWIAPLL